MLIVPHANWRSAYETSTFADGSSSKCVTVWMPANEVLRRDTAGRWSFPADAPDTTQVRCIERDLPGAYMGMTRLLKRQTVWGPISWIGSVVQDGQDASGLSFRRNRYYDPSTGRFTQEDPIGIAGGINLYGFGGGDPVSNSDPYGLAAEQTDPVPLPVPTPFPLAPPITPEMVQFARRIIAAAADAASDAVEELRDKIQIKFVTYTRTDPVTGQVYSGRTSGFGDPQSIVDRRAAGHDPRLARFGRPRVDVWYGGAQGYAPIRGREQMLIDAHGRAQSEGGTSANIIRAVSRRNRLSTLYYAAALEAFGPVVVPKTR